MNVSDLQTVLGLSYSTNNSTLSENKETDYSLHGTSVARSTSRCNSRGKRGGDIVPVSGARPRMSRRHSMENLELMKLTPDKMNVRQRPQRTLIFFKFGPQIIGDFCPPLMVASSSTCVLLKGQKWNSDILTKQSKPSLVKSSSKLFFVNRLRGKKYKTGGSSKVLQDTSNTLESSQAPTQGPQKVCSTFTGVPHTQTSSRLLLFLCLSELPFLSLVSGSVPTCLETRASLTCWVASRATVWMTSAVQSRTRAAGCH